MNFHAFENLFILTYHTLLFWDDQWFKKYTLQSNINMKDSTDSLIQMNHWVTMMWAQVESLFPGSGPAAHTDLCKCLDSLTEIYKHKRTH